MVQKEVFFYLLPLHLTVLHTFLAVFLKKIPEKKLKYSLFYFEILSVLSTINVVSRLDSEHSIVASTKN